MAEITIDAPRERVFATVADLALRPAFCDHFMTQFRLQRIDSRGVGAAARFHVAAPRFPIWMETVVVEADASHMVLERGRGARIDRLPIGTAWELIESSGSMTEVRVSFWTEPGHPVDAIKDKLGSARWYQRQWKRALTRLRDLHEGDVEIESLQVAGASRP